VKDAGNFVVGEIVVLVNFIWAGAFAVLTDIVIISSVAACLRPFAGFASLAPRFANADRRYFETRFDFGRIVYLGSARRLCALREAHP
jgi:hypothetical protein